MIIEVHVYSQISSSEHVLALYKKVMIYFRNDE
jgi:hypothetical protein